MTEILNSDNKQPNEAYDVWKKMADEVVFQGTEKTEITDNYDPGDWIGFEIKIKNPDDKRAFRENMRQLDKRTQKYLNELPGNIDCVFGVNKDSYELLNETLHKIIAKTISGSYTQGERNGKNFNLYMSNDGVLYNGIQAATAREDDADNVDATNTEEKFEDVWTSWMPIAGELKDTFTANMRKLDKRTQKYLRELPGNIDCVFGVNEDSYALANKVKRQIVSRTVHWRYTPRETYNGENWDLYLTDDGQLYSGSHAWDYRVKDMDARRARKSRPQPPVEDDLGNTQTATAEAPDIKTPEDFGFRDW